MQACMQQAAFVSDLVNLAQAVVQEAKPVLHQQSSGQEPAAGQTTWVEKTLGNVHAWVSARLP